MELTNEILREYMALSQEIRDKSKRLETIKQECKQRGSFVTQDFTCLVETTIRTGLPGLEEVTKCIQRNTLEVLGLIRTTQVVSVRILRREDAQLSRS